MASKMQIKRSAVSGKIPVAADLELGELAVNTYDGKLFLKTYNGTEYRIKAVGDDLGFDVKNQTGSTITKGTLVQFSGTLGSSGRLLVAPFIANGTVSSDYFMGVAAYDIPNGEDGFVISQGKLLKFNTSTWADGTVLYASSTTAGAFTSTLPQAPNNKITVAAVVHSHATSGVLEIRVTLGSRLGNDEMVQLSSLAGNQTLYYNSTTQRFENIALKTINGSSLLGTGNLEIGGGGISDGTANGVVYLNGSKVLTTGSALTFDGSFYLGLTGAMKINSNGYKLRFYDATGSTGYGYLYTDGTNLQFDSGNTQPLSFLINGSEQMRLTSTGLGIGTSSPQAKLHVAQSASGILFSQDSTTATVVGTNPAGTASQGLFLRGFPLTFTGNGGGGAEQMRLDSSGNLGLGVTPSAWGRPAMQFQSGGLSAWALGGVNGYLYSNAYYDGSTNRYVNNGTAGSYAINNGSGQHIWFTAPSGTAGNAITFTQAMTLDASGNLGVGATSPSYRLEVRDTADAVIALVKTGANSLRFLSTSSGGVINQVDNNPLAFYTNNTERARIYASGGVYIGSTPTDPGANNLRVQGAITQAGNQVLHADNYTSYSPSLTGSGASGTWGISISGNAAEATRASGQSGYPHAGYGMYAFYNWGGSNGGASAPSASSYTVGLSVGSHPGDQAYGFQIARNMWNTGLWTRGYDSGWSSWVRLLDSSNYTSYSPSLTGSGASGTWGINVTGSAGSVAWTNVSGRPTAVSSFTNDSGYITSSGSITGSSYRISFLDTRATNDQPQGKTGYALSADFKDNTAVGNPPVTASGGYSHILTVAGWDTNGGSGGWPSQLSVGDGIAVRQATSATAWGAWRTVLHSGNYTSYAAPASHSHNYIPINPDGDGNAWTYSDENPTINGVTVGGGQRFGADGSSYEGFLQAKILNAYNGFVNSANGYYVGNFDFGANSNTYSTTKVIDGSGNFIGGKFIALYGNPADTVNGAPWYGLGGAGNLFGAGDVVHLAGYYGLRLRTASAYMDLYQSSAYYSSTFNAATLQNNGNQVLHAGNYTSYSPSLTGSGASGTWGISITGNAATAGGLAPAQFFNNMGNNHSTYTDFNNVPNFGAYYVQQGGNSPTGTASHQWYGFTLGLGNDYALSSYGTQLYWPRAIQNSDTYIYVRDRENGTWGSWRKTRAGYADTAGSATDSTKLPLTGGTLTGALTLKSTRETRVAMAANDVDLATGNYFTKTISGATALTVSNVPSSGTAASFILDLTNGGSATITWWTGMKWAGGTAPTLTAAGRDVLGFFTHDAGTTWTGLLLGKDVK